MEHTPNPYSAKPKARGIYLLPNLFTTAALFAGFYAIMAGIKGFFDAAAIAIFIAMIADSLDGRVARLTNTQTAFGAEYDSLSDMVSFGVAPALLAYSWSLSRLGKIGWLIAFVYAAATALRLARFNTQVHDMDKRYFQGLPCPAAAATIAATVWLGSTYEWAGFALAIPVGLLVITVACLMVSQIRYYSFKQMDIKGRMSFFSTVLIVLILAAVAIAPAQMFFMIFLSYAFSGLALTLWKIRQMKKSKKKK